MQGQVVAGARNGIFIFTDIKALMTNIFTGQRQNTENEFKRQGQS